MPTSKVTRVRSEGFSKMRAMNLPVREEAYRPGRALISAESWSRSSVCAGVHSAPVSRSLDKEMGVTRADVVIFHLAAARTACDKVKYDNISRSEEHTS